MTFQLKLDLDIMRLYRRTKMKFTAEGIKKLEPEEEIRTNSFARDLDLDQMTLIYINLT